MRENLRRNVARNPMELKLQALELQMERVVSDIESEKETRARANANLDERLREVEKTIWKAVGGMGVILAVLTIVVRFLPIK